MTDTKPTIPKQELLLKFLLMTTSDNDGEALTAIRKANALLTSAGWDWDKLIHSKIRIAADPFQGLSTPFVSKPTQSPSTTPRHPASPAPRPAPPKPPQPPVTPIITYPLGIQPNRFAGWCYCCGTEVVANVGVIFRPQQFNSRAPDEWKVVCLQCNGTKTRTGSPTVNTYAASRRPTYNKQGRVRPSVSDLS